jgi:hypothetical protein
MPISFNGTGINSVVFNGTEVNSVYQNGTLVFPAAPAPIATAIGADTNVIVTAGSGGTRTPADKISNYVYVNSGLLTVGQQYAFLLTGSGEQAANRVLANGTTINSRGYNSAVSGSVDGTTVTYQGWQTNGMGYTWALGGFTYVQLMYQGIFTYNPVLITAGNGSSAVGTLIAKNTFNCSDPGKGNATAWVYPLAYLRYLCETYGIPFTTTNINP